MSPRGRPEENFVRRGDPLGLIEVAGSAIHWAGIKKVDASPSSHSVAVAYRIEYGVPDWKFASPLSKVQLSVVRSWSLPFKVKGLRCKTKKGTDQASLSHVLARLNALPIAKPLLEDFGLEIIGLPRESCWILVSSQSRPSKEAWDGFESIARCLVGSAEQ
jgi:hypothetical protein